MSDQQMIRRAVELADGFLQYENSPQLILEYGPTEYDCISTMEGDLDQWFLDALAAQLIRQVDALESQGIELDYFDNDGRGVAVLCDERGLLTVQYGDDRTMNTLRAIVESGVLDE